MQACHLTIVHYPPEQTWSCVEIKSPKWQDVSAAIRRMDDNEYPIVQLSWKDIDSCFDDEASFNIIGGPVSGFALFEVMPGWHFEDPLRSNDDVRLGKRSGIFLQTEEYHHRGRGAGSHLFPNRFLRSRTARVLKKGTDMSGPTPSGHDLPRECAIAAAAVPQTAPDLLHHASRRG
jgi:hypothetical protein